MTVKLIVRATRADGCLDCEANWDDRTEEDTVKENTEGIALLSSSADRAVERLAEWDPSVNWIRMLRDEGVLGETIPDGFLARVPVEDASEQGMSFDEWLVRHPDHKWVVRYHVGDPYDGLAEFRDMDMSEDQWLDFAATVIGRRRDELVIADNTLLRLLARAEKLSDGQRERAYDLLAPWLFDDPEPRSHALSPWMPDEHGYWHTACHGLRAVARNLDTGWPRLVSVHRTFDDLLPLPEGFEQVHGWDQRHSDQRRLKEMAHEYGWLAVSPGAGREKTNELNRIDPDVNWPRILDHTSLFESGDGRRTILASPYLAGVDVDEAVEALRKRFPDATVEARRDSWYYPGRTVDLLITLNDKREQNGRNE